MTNPVTGEDLKAPYIAPQRTAVMEHLVTLPMALALLAFFCGAVAAAGYFPHDSPTQKLLLYIVSGMPMLIAQLGQMWHSRNIRNKVAIANQQENQSS